MKKLVVSFLALALLGLSCPDNFESDDPPPHIDLSEGLETIDPDPNGLACNGVELEKSEADARGVYVYKLTDGKCYPAYQFSKPSKPDLCGEFHFHYDLFDITGEVRMNLPGFDCGAATMSDIIDEGPIHIKRDAILHYNYTLDEHAEANKNSIGVEPLSEFEDLTLPPDYLDGFRS